MLNLYNLIFTSEKEALRYLEENKLLNPPSICPCGGKLNKISDFTRRSGFFLKCVICKRKKNYLDGTFFNKYKITVNEYLKIMFFILIDLIPFR